MLRKSAVITAGKSRVTLSFTPGENYPSWPSPPEALAKLEGFAEAVKIVSLAAKKDHPVLRGMRMAITDDHLQMTCTDGSRMAFASLPIRRTLLTPGDPVLAPTAILERFSRVAEGEVSLGWSHDPNLLGMSCEGLEVSARHTAGEFPKTWTMILKDHEPVMRVNVAELSQMIKMAAVTAGDKGAVTLEFSDTGQLAVGTSGYLGVMETEGSLDPRILDFTPQYLLDGLHGEEVSLSYTGRALMILERTTGH